MKLFKNHFHTSLALLLGLFLFTQPLLANHQGTEPSDGSVDSFRWLKKPLPVGAAVFHDIEGKVFDFSRFEGKVVLLNLWASWCAPCIRELPALERLQQRLGGEDFVVLTISIDEEAELARKMFVDQLALEHLPLYLADAEQLRQFFPVDVLPSSFFIDRQGRAMGLLRSYVEWDDPLADKLIERLVDGVEASTLRAEKAQ